MILSAEYIENLRYTPLIINIIMVIFIMIIGYIVISLVSSLIKSHKQKSRNYMVYALYKRIEEDPYQFKYISKYGIENALITFNAEIPYIIHSMDVGGAKNKQLVEIHRSKIESDEVMKVYFEIEAKLALMLSNTVLNLVSRCNYFCNNASKLTTIECNPRLIQEYVKNGDLLYQRFKLLQEEEFDSEETKVLSYTVFNTLLEFFNNVNSMIIIKENKISKIQGGKSNGKC